MRDRDKTILGLIALLIVAVGGYFAIVKPKASQARSLQAQIASAQGEVAQAEAEVQAGLRDRAAYASFSHQLAGVRTAVPSDAQIPQLIEELQGAASQNHVGFQAVSAASASTPTAGVGAASSATGSFPSQSFNLSFTGNYFSVVHLLGALEGFVHGDDRAFHATGRLLSISSLTLAPGGAGAGASSTTPVGAGAVTATVSAVDYDLPASLATPAATATAPLTTATPAADVTP